MEVIWFDRMDGVMCAVKKEVVSMCIYKVKEANFIHVKRTPRPDIPTCWY